MNANDFNKIFSRRNLSNNNQFSNFMNSIGNLSINERESLHNWDPKENFGTNCAYQLNSMSPNQQQIFINSSYMRYKK